MAAQKPGYFLLYSTVTELAYKIAKEFYNNEQYVWCTEAFDAAVQPGTSNPRTLCSRYLEQILKEDRHATEIANNKSGILKGAREKFKQGVITEEQHLEIQRRVASARFEDFFPCIFLINKSAVKSRLIEVSADDKASESSIEYIIKDLKQNEFDVIRLKNVLRGAVPVSIE